MKGVFVEENLTEKENESEERAKGFRLLHFVIDVLVVPILIGATFKNLVYFSVLSSSHAVLYGTIVSVSYFAGYLMRSKTNWVERAVKL